MLSIKLYWILIPKSKRRCCLFQESCSNYVYRITNEKGTLKGMKAFLFRYKFCRPGNQIIEIKGRKFLATNKFQLIEVADQL